MPIVSFAEYALHLVWGIFVLTGIKAVFDELVIIDSGKRRSENRAREKVVYTSKSGVQRGRGREVGQNKGIDTEASVSNCGYISGCINYLVCYY